MFDDVYLQVKLNLSPSSLEWKSSPLFVTAVNKIAFLQSFHDHCGAAESFSIAH